MKQWLIVGLLLICCVALANRRALLMTRTAAAGGGGGSLAFVRSTNGPSVYLADVMYLTNTVTAGNLLVACVYWEDIGATPSVTDSLGNTYTEVARTNSGGTCYSAILYAKNVSGGSNVIITNRCTGANAMNAALMEFSGASTSTPLDQGATGAGNSTAVDTHNFTTGTADEILVACVGLYGTRTITHQASWTEDDEVGTLETQYRIVSSTGTYKGSATLDSSVQWAITAASFK